MFWITSSGKKDPLSQQPDFETDHLAIWDGKRTKDVGTLLNEDWCQPQAINNHGEITGTVGPYAMRPGDVEPEDVHLFLWSGGFMHDLGSAGQPNGINDLGQVVGEKTWPDGQHGFLYSHGKMQEIKNPLSLEYSDIKAINNKSQMVGIVSGPSKRTGPQPNALIYTFIWNKGIPSEIRLPETSKFSLNGGAVAINDSGQVVINADHLDEAGAKSGLGVLSRCYLWQSGVVTNLGTLSDCSMSAVAINNRGQVIGNATQTGGYLQSNITRPFLWQDGVLYDLNDLIRNSGWTLTHVTGLNNQGQIVGYRQRKDRYDSFLLTPMPQ